MLRRHAISDEHWERIKGFLPGQDGDPGVTGLPRTVKGSTARTLAEATSREGKASRRTASSPAK